MNKTKDSKMQHNNETSKHTSTYCVWRKFPQVITGLAGWLECDFRFHLVELYSLTWVGAAPGFFERVGQL